MNISFEDFEISYEAYQGFEDIEKKNKFKILISNTLKDYEGITYVFDLFKNIEEIRGFKRFIENLYDEKGYKKEEMIYLYCMTQYRGIVKFILDLYEKEEEEEEKNEFEWKENQLEGIENAIACDFASGIHSQATGTGKSLMALHIMQKYHEKYPTNSMMWLCERKDIPDKLFFSKKKNEDGTIESVKNTENYRKWRDYGIIDMYQFEIINLVTEKPMNWVKLLNKETDKPKFIIVNRAFLTTNSNDKKYKFKYEEVNYEVAPKLIVHDECHSTAAPRTYELLLHMKEKWSSKIQGLSATPYREGLTKTKISIELKEENKEKWETMNNINRLINVYPHPENENQIHLLSQCDLKRAIEEEFILEPVFHWFYIDEYGKKGKSKFSNDEFESMIAALINMIEKCPYKKVLIWCKYVSIAESMYTKFEDSKNIYPELKDMETYLYHSNVDSSFKDDYDNFYKATTNSIMFCANMFREGSDIPNLSGALFLDKVKERGEIPFIQSVGRVLRKDPEGLKTHGHILDCCVKPKVSEKEEDKEKALQKMNRTKIGSIMNKMIKYYLKLYELTAIDKTSSENTFEISKMRVKKYMEIMNNFEPEPETNLIHLHLKNKKKVTIDMKELELHSMDWRTLTNQFEKVWERYFNFNDIEDFMKLKFLIEKKKIETIEEYKKYCILNPESNFPKDPKSKYSRFWKGWYDFLSIDTSKYPTSKEIWIKKCEELEITNMEEYMIHYRKYNLPPYPEQFYSNFMSIDEELSNPDTLELF